VGGYQEGRKKGGGGGGELPVPSNTKEKTCVKEKLKKGGDRNHGQRKKLLHQKNRGGGTIPFGGKSTVGGKEDKKRLNISRKGEGSVTKSHRTEFSARGRIKKKISPLQSQGGRLPIPCQKIPQSLKRRRRTNERNLREKKRNFSRSPKKDRGITLFRKGQGGLSRNLRPRS